MMASKRRNIRMIPLTAIFGIVSTYTVAASTMDVVEVRYSIPNIITKMILVDDGNLQQDQFRSELNEVAQIHMLNFFLDELPNDSELLNRHQFRSITLQSFIDKIPVDVGNSTSIRLSVMRSEFQGFGTFALPNEVVQSRGLSVDDINNTTDLRSPTLNAFRLHVGFWDFAGMILDNKVLKHTGKIQIAVEEVIVAEADLIYDKPKEEHDNNNDDDKSVVAIVMIYVAIAVVVSMIALVLLMWYFRRQEKELERKSNARREQSKKVRLKSLGNTDSSLGGSVSVVDDDSFYINKTSQVISPPRVEANPDFLDQVTAVQSIIAAEAENESNNNFYDSMDRITDELIRLENTPFTKQTLITATKMKTEQSDDEDSEFYSVQSQSANESEREETIKELRSSNQPTSKNSIVSIDETRIRQKRRSLSNTKQQTKLKPAIKNSNDGRQYIAPRYLRNNSMSMVHQFHNSMSTGHQFHNSMSTGHQFSSSIRRSSVTNANQMAVSPSKAIPQVSIKQKMNLGTTGSAATSTIPTSPRKVSVKVMKPSSSSVIANRNKNNTLPLPSRKQHRSSSLSLKDITTSPTKVTVQNSTRLRYLNTSNSSDSNNGSSSNSLGIDICNGLDGFVLSPSTSPKDILTGDSADNTINQNNSSIRSNGTTGSHSDSTGSSMSFSWMGNKKLTSMDESFCFT